MVRRNLSYIIPGKIYYFLIIMCFTGSIICYGSDFKLGSWNTIGIKYHFTEKSCLSGNTQLRSIDFYNEFYYYYFQIRFDYRIHPNVIFNFAAGDFETYSEGGNFLIPKRTDEYRIMPQITMIQPVWKFRIEQLYRLEYQFSRDNIANRFKYRFGISFPFGKSKEGYKPYSLRLTNDFFYTDKERFYTINRVYFSFAYSITTEASVKVGYLHQFDYKILDDIGRNYLQLGLIINLNRKSLITEWV